MFCLGSWPLSHFSIRANWSSVLVHYMYSGIGSIRLMQAILCCFQTSEGLKLCHCNLLGPPSKATTYRSKDVVTWYYLYRQEGPELATWLPGLVPKLLLDPHPCSGEPSGPHWSADSLHQYFLLKPAHNPILALHQIHIASSCPRRASASHFRH